VKKQLEVIVLSTFGGDVLFVRVFAEIHKGVMFVSNQFQSQSILSPASIRSLLVACGPCSELALGGSDPAVMDGNVVSHVMNMSKDTVMHLTLFDHAIDHLPTFLAGCANVCAVALIGKRKAMSYDAEVPHLNYSVTRFTTVGTTIFEEEDAGEAITGFLDNNPQLEVMMLADIRHLVGPIYAKRPLVVFETNEEHNCLESSHKEDNKFLRVVWNVGCSVNASFGGILEKECLEFAHLKRTYLF